MNPISHEPGKTVDSLTDLNTNARTERTQYLDFHERRALAAEHLRSAVVDTLVELGRLNYQVRAVNHSTHYDGGIVESIGAIVTESRPRRFLGIPLPNSKSIIFEVGMTVSSSPRNPGQTSGLSFSAGAKDDAELCERIEAKYSQTMSEAGMYAFNPARMKR